MYIYIYTIDVPYSTGIPDISPPPRGLPCEVGNSVSITLYDVTQSVALTEDGLKGRSSALKDGDPSRKSLVLMGKLWRITFV